jgi:hypothetical protein
MDASFSELIIMERTAQFTWLLPAWWACFSHHLAYKTRYNEVEKKEK